MLRLGHAWTPTLLYHTWSVLSRQCRCNHATGNMPSHKISSSLLSPLAWASHIVASMESNTVQYLSSNMILGIVIEHKHGLCISTWNSDLMSPEHLELCSLTCEDARSFKSTNSRPSSIVDGDILPSYKAPFNVPSSNGPAADSGKWACASIREGTKAGPDRAAEIEPTVRKANQRDRAGGF